MNDSKKILIVEDAPTQRAILKNLVKELGFDPVCPEIFDNTLLSVITENAIKIVLLDLILLDENGLAVGDGFQICGQIKALDPQIKVIIITAESDSTAKSFAEFQGADGFINKPFKIEALESILKSMTY